MTNSSPIALITGGSRGLGRATALALATEGADVIITYNSNEDAAREAVAAVEALGRRATALQLDTGDVASFPAFVEALPADRIDILINNAGGSLHAALAETTEAEFDEVFAVHVKGPFFLTQALLPHLADGAKIINIGTGLTRFAFPGSGAYAAAKGAIDVLTKYQALELGTRGITANVIAPGAVPTDFSGGMVRDSAEMQQAITGDTALGRLATPQDIGQAIAGLALRSGTWVSGQRIEASGGFRL
ncbi:SDR family NAD(P)-dependent oxidoreductase [Baekduia sp. Peel2402]|uniref:SDR family NAD(P)-dependent oxidoreductase n=1 Tax=Baekduia sp. Peel2402 TaxID=3458296 RepID=UPI00403ED99F